MSLKFKKSHLNWNATQIRMLLKLEFHSNKMSLKLECHSNWNVSKVLMSLKLEE